MTSKRWRSCTSTTRWTRLTFWSQGQVAETAFVDVRARAALSAAVNEATLECALLHLRNVVDFLLNLPPTNPGFQTDVVADDYFDTSWSGRPVFLLGDDAEAHKGLMKDLHRRLAHLSTQRLQKQTPTGGFDWTEVFTNSPPSASGVRAVRDRLERPAPGAGKVVPYDTCPSTRGRQPARTRRGGARMSVGERAI